ncbi:MAG: type B DNA-directed DNA polymerase [Methanolinea sp.]|jgi:DNA polymerase I|nr:type B DNA-directed DNA polymerase [Methanolinea sp.]
MWILDTCSRNGQVETWERGRGGRHLVIPAPPSFLLYLPDPHAHGDLLEGLECRFPLEECHIRTVYETLDGYRVQAGREVADLVERQTQYEALIFNADLRLDQCVLAERNLVPCSEEGESRFSIDLLSDLPAMEISVADNPFTPGPVTSLSLLVDGRQVRLEGDEKTIISDMEALIRSADPDVILFPQADVWVPRLAARAAEYGLGTGFSRSGRFRRLSAKSYWSYGKTEYRVGALIPDGRLLVDTRQSFHYRESGLAGILLGARLSGLPPNLSARFTSGTLISSYEVYEALRQGIAVPYRKSDPEAVRRFSSLKAADRGGMMFQPRPGIYTAVHEIDFTSLYPSLIVRDNLSPETLAHPGRRGFLPGVLAPLIAMRMETKQKKAHDPRYAGLDAILKWMLVTCFGYTGYRNAKFGRIEVHEAITGSARDVLLHVKDIAEEMGFAVLHGIVDCLWVQGEAVTAFKERVERETRLHTVVDAYDWLVFLPMADRSGAYNRYYGRFADGSLKVRGIASRRGDTPVCIRNVQQEMLALLGQARTLPEIASFREPLRERYRQIRETLPLVRPAEMAISRQISTLRYRHACPEASAVQACAAEGIALSPGMEVSYVVTDARTWAVDLDWKATRFDVGYYQRLLQKAWEEVIFAVEQAEMEGG